MGSPSSQASALAAGATLGGALIGVAEAAYRSASYAFAAALYAALWAVIGTLLALPVRLSLVHRLRKHVTFAAGAAFAVSVSSAVLVRFTLFRDAFAEAPSSLIWATAGGGAAALVSGATVFFSLRPVPAASLWSLVAPGAMVIFCGTIYGVPGAAIPSVSAAPRVRTGPHVIVVVADALRADAIGAFGAAPHRGSPATPAIDAFAAGGRAFTRVSAQASWTKPTMASLLTSRLVSGHGAMSKTAVLPANLPTLASELQKQGIGTGAVVTNYNLDESFGFSRGFDEFTYLEPSRYLNAPPKANRLAAYNVYRLARERFFRSGRESRFFYRSAQDVNAEAFRLLDHATKSRLFMWLHYMEAHDPYFDEEGSSWARVSDPRPPQAMAAAMHRAYRDGVRRVDTAFEQLLAGLQRRGMLENTLVILTADHGEEFGEHRGFYHGTSLYEELLHIPLIMAGPGIEAGTVNALARQIDLAPSVLDFFGLPAPPTWEGTSLFHIGSASWSKTVAIAEENHEGNVLKSITAAKDANSDSFKVIVANRANPRGLPQAEFFDLDADPLERVPLAVHTSQFTDLSRQLDSTCGASAVGAGLTTYHTVDDAGRADLRALGYVQ